MLTFGPRSTFGLFMQPMSREFSWGRDVFALAFAIQNLLWGLGQPIAGALADRFGVARVLAVGAALYALGLTLMCYASTPLMLNLSSGVLVGFGLSGCSFALVIAAFGKIVPKQWSAVALGFGTAAGSFGQFVFAPVSVLLLGSYGWPGTLMVFATLVLLVIPLAFVLATPPSADTPAGAAPVAEQSFSQAMAEAFGHRSYVLLVLGFFTCGFQIAFVTAHLPSYLVDRGLTVGIGGTVIAAIGLFNIIGSLSVGWIATYVPKRIILSCIYAIRALSIIAFISFPISPTSAILFGVITGLTWLSTVPPTSGLVSLMFGTRWLATLFGVAFFSHQVGAFLGSWLGAVVFERTGSYNGVWWLSVFFGLASALINLPIVEKPVPRQAAQPA